MSITITSLQSPAAPSPAGSPDEGFGALSTERGNLPLEALDVRLVTTGLAVRTELTQTFRNPYPEPLEATYVFPLPDRSALVSMRMEADDRVIDGALREREQARADYDKAIDEGKRASIAEEERPGVFTMRVGNIMPGERVSIRLTLAGRLGYEDGAVTLRFPLVVAPRYIPGSPLDDPSVGSGVEPDTDAVPDASRITPPVLLPGCPSPIDLSIEADIDPAGMPVVEAASSLHPVAVEHLEEERVRVRVHPGERADRDFILRLRLADDRAISSTLVVVPDASTRADNDLPDDDLPDDDLPDDDSPDAEAIDVEGDGTFALTLLPPVLPGATSARDVVFVLDRSGSMAGWKMVTARRATARMLDTLSGADRFAVLAFDHDIETPASMSGSLVPATDRNRFRAVEFLARLEARGGTEMLSPLVRGADLLTSSADEFPSSTDSGRHRDLVLVLVTDGQVGNEDQILATLAPRLSGVRIHTVGIDVAVNDAFLRRIAALGGGHCEQVESEDRLDAAMEAIHRRVGSPLVTNLAVEADGLDIVPGSLTPSPLPGLYAGAALQLTGRYRGRGQGAVTVTGRAAGGSSWSTTLAAVPSDNTGLAGVWARGRLRDLEDRYVVSTGPFGDVGRHAKKLERQIVATSLRFGVLCRFTAYVAIDSRVVNEGGTQRRVTQPVELPQGWELAGSTPPVARAASARRMRAAASGPAFAGAANLAQSPIPASPGQLPGTAVGIPFGRAPGATLWRGSPAEAASHGPGRRADLTSEQFAQLDRVRTTLGAELSRLESAGDADRLGHLKDLGDLLTSLLADIEVPDDLGGLEPLRDLAGDLRAYARLAEPDPVEGDRLWLRVVDVLGAWADGAGDLWAITTAATPAPTTQGRSAGARANPDTSSASGPRRTFWRRTR